MERNSFMELISWRENHKQKISSTVNESISVTISALGSLGFFFF